MLHLEREDRRIVHEHAPVGIPNQEVFGISFTYGMEDIARAVESDRPGLRLVYDLVVDRRDFVFGDGRDVTVKGIDGSQLV